MTRPYVVASVAVSLDGCMDDASDDRLVLSTPEDLDLVDELRSGVDAILVGANTVRRDDPRLLVRSPARRAARTADGLPAGPARVTVTGSGALDPAARLFTVGDTERLVYAGSPACAATRALLGSVATVLDAGQPPRLDAVLADLAGRGVRRLLVEGGARVHTALLAAGAVDELRLAIAPVLVGDADAPRFAGPAAFPADRALRLEDVTRLGDLVVLRYLAGPPS